LKKIDNLGQYYHVSFSFSAKLKAAEGELEELKAQGILIFDKFKRRVL